MKSSKGISCTANAYTVIAIVNTSDGIKQLEFPANRRDARVHKAAVAGRFGVKSSQVLVNYTLNKRRFTIDTSDIDGFIEYCNNGGYEVCEGTITPDSDSE